MEKYSWTWEEYQSNPEWLNSAAKCKMSVEAEYERLEASKRKK